MDIENVVSFFLVFSVVKIGFGKNFIKSYPFGLCKDLKPILLLGVFIDHRKEM